jgi:HlyD family secretion protein
MNWKKWTGLAVLLAVIGFIGYSIYSSSQEEVLPTVRTAEVTEGDLTEIVSTNGVIEPVETQEIIGQGLVSELNVEVGDTVSEGDTLVVYADEFGTTFEAAFDGTVTEVNIVEGEPDGNAQQGIPSIVIADLNDFQVGVRLSRSDANLVEVDQPVTLDYAGTEYEGHVASIDPIATSEDSGMAIPGMNTGGSGSSLGVTIAFDSDTEGLIAGFDIDADIEIAYAENTLILPIEALNYNSDNEAFVYVIENGVAVERMIETGIQSNADIEVTEGLSSGDNVILSPNEEITDGTEVEIQED